MGLRKNFILSQTHALKVHGGLVSLLTIVATALALRVVVNEKSGILR